MAAKKLDVRTHPVQVPGPLSINVEEVGQGPWFLMLHAGVADRHMWDRQWEWLSYSHRVVRWDWRGFGDTVHVPGPFSYANDVIAIMDQLDIASTRLMGCSFGGAVAIQVAIQHPSRVDGLVLVGSGVPGYEASNPPHVENLLVEADQALEQGDTRRFMHLMEQLWLVGPGRQIADVDPAYLARARKLLARAGQPDNGAISEDREWSALDRLSTVAVPSLIIVGDQDVPDIVTTAHYLRDTLPNARLETIANAAHLPNLERPRHFDALLSEWLAETSPPRVAP